MFAGARAAKYAVGDHVVIVHPCTAAWLAAVDDGATASDAPWEVGSQPLVFKRQIVAIEGATAAACASARARVLKIGASRRSREAGLKW